MKIKGYISEDFVNYKKVSMTIMFPYCTMKCGKELCQNNPLLLEPDYEVTADSMIDKYLNNPITESIVLQGMEPFDSWSDVLELVQKFRALSEDDLVIYTGYTEDELQEKLSILETYKNIIVKFGRYVSNQESHFDEVLGVNLISDNQYARKIS